MFTPTPAAAQSLRRLPAASRWLVPAFAALTLTGFGAAQNYGQQNSPQQGYGEPNAQQMPQDTAQDPPSRVARLSLVQGTVSFQPASVQEFSPAEVNYPLTTGDRVWADAGALTELQLGGIAVRLGQQTDFTVTGLTDTLAQFGLAQGSVHLRTFLADPGTTTELDTPNAAITVLAPGDLRIDVYPSNDVTVVTLLSGAAQVDAQGFSQQLNPGESLQLSGANPVYAQDVRRMAPDGLDGFSAGQDSSYESALASENGYLSDATIGASDLGNYGDWSADPDNGAVWFPRGVSVGWQPYRLGHWAWIAPWGWTWIESEPWGFAPFHYGRWAQFGGRWGWIPGPRVVRPVYSPALVVFVGGADFSVHLGFGGAPGAGVTAWFPLGPREPFQPWYHTSDRYITRVNVTNIYNRNTVEVRNVYAGRGPSPFQQPDPNRQYVNRSVATVAVPQQAFASGRSVPGSALRIAPGQFANAPVLPHPLVSPTRAMVAPAPARALPPQIARPELETRGGNAPMQRQPAPEVRGSAQPAFRAGTQPAPISRPGTGYTGANPNPAQNQPGPMNRGGPQRGALPSQQQPAPVVPTTQPPRTSSQPAPAAQNTIQPRSYTPMPTHEPPTQVQEPAQQPVQRPVQQQQGQLPAPVTQRPTTAPLGPSGQASQPGPINHSGPQRSTFNGNPNSAAPQPAAQQPAAPAQRPLVNRTEPPAPRPSFDQQREAIERTDPGRPLGPQQINNLQQNRPAGPPTQREAVPHPAPQPQRPTAAPAPAPKDDKKK